MKTIEIHGQTGHSRILVGESLQNLERYVTNQRAVIITDTEVSRYYRHTFPGWDVIEIGTGEEIKTLETMQSIYRELVDLEIDRSCFIIGIGGGIVCDIAGFAASTYMRGLPFGFVSSTLLSQVDASVGGKNGVNFHGYKNMIGVFNQPGFVICDLAMLETLPHRELACGFAEVVKHAAIGSAALFDFLRSGCDDALALDRGIMERAVYDSITIKAAVVQQDEREKGERRKLNFGHTLAHALEKTTGIPHGEAVSIGMVFAAGLSVRRGLLSNGESGELRQLLTRLHLPTEMSIDKKNVGNAIKKDKKRQGQGIHFVLLKSIGQAVVEELTIEELEAAIDDMY